MDNKVITAHIHSSLSEKVNQIATKLERPKSWIVKQALSAWVDQEEKQKKFIPEVLADVDENRMVTRKKTTEEKRTEVVQLYLTLEEKKRLEEKAGLVPLAAFVRHNLKINNFI